MEKHVLWLPGVKTHYVTKGIRALLTRLSRPRWTQRHPECVMLLVGRPLQRPNADWIPNDASTIAIAIPYRWMEIPISPSHPPARTITLVPPLAFKAVQNFQQAEYPCNNIFYFFSVFHDNFICSFVIFLAPFVECGFFFLSSVCRKFCKTYDISQECFLLAFSHVRRSFIKILFSWGNCWIRIGLHRSRSIHLTCIFFRSIYILYIASYQFIS